MNKEKIIKIFEEVVDKYELSELNVIQERSLSCENAEEHLENDIIFFKEQFYKAFEEEKSEENTYFIGNEKLTYLHRCAKCQNIIDLFGRENYSKTLICECGIKYLIKGDGSIIKHN